MQDFLIELPPKGFLLKKRIQERDLRLCWGPFIGFLFRDVPTFLQGNFPQNIHFGNLSLAAAAEQNPFGTRVVLRLQSFTAPYLRMSSVHIATQSINHLDVAQLMENVAWGWLVQGSIGCQASKRSPSTRSSLQQLYMALNWDGRAKNMDGYSNRFIPPSKNAEINCSMFFLSSVLWTFGKFCSCWDGRSWIVAVTSRILQISKGWQFSYLPIFAIRIWHHPSDISNQIRLAMV